MAGRALAATPTMRECLQPVPLPEFWNLFCLVRASSRVFARKASLHCSLVESLARTHYLLKHHLPFVHPSIVCPAGASLTPSPTA